MVKYYDMDTSIKQKSLGIVAQPMSITALSKSKYIPTTIPNANLTPNPKPNPSPSRNRNTNVAQKLSICIL